MSIEDVKELVTMTVYSEGSVSTAALSANETLQVLFADFHDGAQITEAGRTPVALGGVTVAHKLFLAYRVKDHDVMLYMNER